MGSFNYPWLFYDLAAFVSKNLVERYVFENGCCTIFGVYRFDYYGLNTADQNVLKMDV